MQHLLSIIIRPNRQRKKLIFKPDSLIDQEKLTEDEKNPDNDIRHFLQRRERT